MREVKYCFFVCPAGLYINLVMDMPKCSSAIVRFLPLRIIVPKQNTKFSSNRGDYTYNYWKVCTREEHIAYCNKRHTFEYFVIYCNNNVISGHILILNTNDFEQPYILLIRLYYRAICHITDGIVYYREIPLYYIRFDGC